MHEVVDQVCNIFIKIITFVSSLVYDIFKCDIEFSAVDIIIYIWVSLFLVECVVCTVCANVSHLWFKL